MPTIIMIKRGLSNQTSTLSLSAGEPAFTTDTGKLYIGNGTSNILINPIDPPIGLNTTTLYSKVKVNNYGQVVAQSNLTASDIPTIASTQVSGLGTASSKNIGLLSGEIPTLDISNKFPVSTIPELPIRLDNINAYYSGADLNIAQNTFVAFNTPQITGTAFSLNADGTILFKETGVYLINYNVTSKTNMMTTTLALSSGGALTGSMCQSSSTSSPPVCTCSTSYIRSITANTIIGVKNYAATTLIIPSGYALISAIKIW